MDNVQDHELKLLRKLDIRSNALMGGLSYDSLWASKVLDEYGDQLRHLYF